MVIILPFSKQLASCPRTTAIQGASSSECFEMLPVPVISLSFCSKFTFCSMNCKNEPEHFKYFFFASWHVKLCH